MRRFKWFLIPAVAAAVISAGTWAYIEFLHGDAPDLLTFAGASTETTEATTAAPSSGVDGTWTATAGSEAGYRVKEVLFGRSTEAVGRTTEVEGRLVMAGTRVTSATVVVDLTSVRSDESRRDNQFRGRIMAVDTYPTAVFELSQPIELGTLPSEGTQVTFPATGALTRRGVSRPVTVDLSARRQGTTIEVLGTIPVDFADYGIADPSFGGVTADDHGEIEFLVVFAPG